MRKAAGVWAALGALIVAAGTAVAGGSAGAATTSGTPDTQAVVRAVAGSAQTAARGRLCGDSTLIPCQASRLRMLRANRRALSLSEGNEVSVALRPKFCA